METMQRRILSKVEEAITAAKLDAVERTHYANTGHIYAMSGLDTTVIVSYQFDDRSCAIGFAGKSLENAHNGGHVDDSPPLYRLRMLSKGLKLDYLNLEYDNAQRLGEMLATLNLLLDERLR